MELRNIGLSDIQVTPLTFGAWAIGGWQWGGDVDKKAAIDAIHRAIDMGINSIDTVPVYGLGLSEEIVGEATKGLRNKVNIFTKVESDGILKRANISLIPTILGR